MISASCLSFNRSEYSRATARILPTCLLACLAIAFVASSVAAQTTYDWTGNSNNNWDNAGNWGNASGYPDDPMHNARFNDTNFGGSHTTIDLRGGSRDVLNLLMGQTGLLLEFKSSSGGSGLIRLNGNMNFTNGDGGAETGPHDFMTNIEVVGASLWTRGLNHYVDVYGVLSGSGTLTATANASGANGVHSIWRSANTFTGTLIIDNVYVLLRDPDAFQYATVEIDVDDGFRVQNNTADDFLNQTIHIGPLSGTGRLDWKSNHFVTTSDSNTTFSGTLQSTGSNSASRNFTKAGTGILTLSGQITNFGTLYNTGGGEVEITHGGTWQRIEANSGTIDIRGGATVNLANAGPDVFFLNGGGSAFIREGADVTLTSTATNPTPRVVQTGGGSFNISGSGSTLTAPRVTVGPSGIGSQLFVADDGGAVDVGLLQVGDIAPDDGSSGTAAASNGGTIDADQISLFPRGTLLVSGGQIVADQIVVGGSTDPMALTDGTPGAALVIGGNGGSSTFNNVIQNSVGGAGSIRKEGAGTLTLGGANTFSGGVTVNGGTLLATNTSGSATGSGSVTVANGATLGGTGTCAGAITVQSGGTVAPGASIGTLTVGDITFDAGSKLDIEFTIHLQAATTDRLIVSNTATLGGTLDLSQLNVDELFPGNTFVVLKAGNLVGTFDDLISPDDRPWLITYHAGLGEVRVTPCSDADSDGVCDVNDPCPNDNPDDTDGDGVCDSNDACPGFDDNADADSDGVPDGCDVCAGGNDNMDSDNDGVADFCDPCPNDNPNDSDSDGVCDSVDACPGFDDSLDADNDGVADGCDVCPGSNDNADDDSDGVPNGCDVCAGGDDNIDSDDDGVPDFCDTCPLDNPNDSDNDGVCDSNDICPGGDDTVDTDNDGIPDGCDTCPGSPNVHNVTQDAYYLTIQTALDAALDGDVIQLGACTFLESNLEMPVNVNLTLQGAGASESIISCTGPGFRFRSSLTPNTSTIRNLAIIGSNAEGAISMGENQSPTIQSVIFQHWGGLFVASGGDAPLFDRCLFVDNENAENGVMVKYSTILRQCVFVNSGWVDAVFAWNGSTPQLINCTINSPGGIFADANAVMVLTNTIVKGDVTLYENGMLNASRSMYVGATGDNIDADPVFSDSYRLVEGSPAIDAANYDAYITAGGGATDIDGAPRTHDDLGVVDTGVGAITHLDIGAAEFQFFSDSDDDGVGDAFDICSGFDDNVDTDNDNVPDGCDVCAGFDDSMDADSDGVPDGCDVCAGFDDIEDADDDGTPDGCDVCPGFNDYNDMDNDGIPDACDADCTTFPVSVATAQELVDAIDCANYLPDSGTIYLDADITLISELSVSSPIVIEGQGHVIERDSGANLNQMIFVSTTGELTLRELTLRNGASSHGGAVRVTSGTLTMIDCQVMDSSGHFGGGAILAQNNSDVTLERVIMTNNVTDSGNGGALEMVGGTLAIRDSVFAGNTARSGSAVYIDGVNQPLVANSIFSGNYADGNGGAVWNKNGTITLVNCTLVNNRGLTNGCGLFTTAGATSNLINCVVGGNTTDSGSSSEIYTDIGGTFNMSFTALKGGIPSIAGSYNDLGGNLSFTNPSLVFVNPIDATNAPTTDGDYHLLPNAVVIDQGDNSEATNAGLTTDIDGDDRIIGLTVDMGADEATCSLDGDDDLDGVCNSADVCPGFDDKADADGDGTPDACDFCPDSPNIHNVSQDVYYATIQAALNAAQNGDLIQLGACTFEESGLTFPFGVKLTLQGAGAAETTFNCIGAGPAIKIFGSAAPNSPDIRDLTITGGTSGLAISLSEGDAPTLQSVVVQQWGGSGIIAGGANVVLDRCFFVDNATDYGIAVGSSSIIRQCVIVNTGTTVSVFGVGGSTQIVNSTINSAGGLYVEDGIALNLVNSIVKGPVSVATTGTLNASRSMFVGATGDNIDADPELSDSYKLAQGSPAIDAADDDAYIAAGGGTTDVDGQPRTHDDLGVADTGTGATTSLDIGAFEFQGLTDSDGDGVGDAVDACPGFDDSIDADNDGIPDACDDDCVNASIHVTTAQELIDAIHCANYAPNTSTIYLEADIVLTQQDNGALGGNGLPVVTTLIEIEGQGHTIERDISAPLFRMLAVDGGDLTLRDTTLLNGLTTQGGSIRVKSGSLTLINCQVMNSAGHFGAGGIYAHNNSHLTLYRVIMTGNSTDSGIGGAILIQGGTLAVHDSVFAGNSAVGSGAMEIAGVSQAIVTNTIVSGNYATIGAGGGINNINSTLSLVNCTIAGNSSADSGGGLRTAIGSTSTMINCVAWGNTAAFGPQLSTEEDGTLNVSFNGLEGGLAAVDGPFNDNGGNQTFTNADLVFVNPIDPTNAPTTAGDYHLATNSVAINLGDNAAATNAGLFFDIDGDARIIAGVVDLGADEVDACNGGADSDGDGVCDAFDACPGFDDNIDTDNDGVPDACDYCPNRRTGDVNGDGSVNLDDVVPFVQVLLDPNYGTPEDRCAADMNIDSFANGDDIQFLLEELLVP
ncbi:MAG: autotransporter-associated beta strand repeat-containing protein [Phycisphaerales bacterium]|nr:autotransporter-associated beta strand repeat-containing protein [Phycisphaerales bacterium]MCB9857184.1 autotransporter-associated beta strand repeat-containing protein [Phycisphaerales bacterium]MCB9863103.1 autotransporter-associated beta strand repeat-containing protein [Phycisphaerales bacterium]